MKDRVFIIWSGDKNVATQVKSILERQYNYVCSIGGNDDNDSDRASVGDTVIQQIKGCNQAIVIFQNRADGAVSNNLFFELGYVFAAYGARKVHCVKRKSEKVVLPTDFDNSFVEAIKEEENGVDVFAQGIVDYFIGRQKMSINENKMFLINNRYLIHDKIVSHYSEAGSKCSDYELAQYILFYTQAAHMFGDEDKVHKEILEFKNKHYYEFSTELALAVNLSLTFLDLVDNIKLDENTLEVYIDQDVFWKIKNEYTHYSTSLKSDATGIFDEWADVFINEQFAFAYMLFANNSATDNSMRLGLHKKAMEYAYKTLDAMDRLEKSAPCKENNDSVGLLSLFRAYVYRNLYIAKTELGEEDANVWLEKTMHERASLKNHFGKGTIDTQLYENFCMEYYLSIVNYLSTKKEDEIDPFEVLMYKNEIKSYLDSIKRESSISVYLKQIAHWCNS